VYSFIRSLLFRLDPEVSHRLTLQLMRLAGIPPIHAALWTMYASPAKPVSAFGLRFRNPVGLAAGYDKDAIAVQGLSALGFGHIEVGTVTPLPQPGNPKPRLFRLEEDQALINRLGFPGRGAVFVCKRLKKKHPKDLILGVNLGRNKQSANEEALFDYLSLLETFAPLADYLAINVSSPNTVGLRELQGRATLEGLLSELNQQRHFEQNKLRKRVPLLVKLAPDLTESQLDDALEAISHTHMDGVIVTNTTLDRTGLRSPHQAESGGLSGRPLAIQSEAMLRLVMKKIGDWIPVVSVGGIMSSEDAKRRLDMGAALVQVYTGLVYAGPGLVKSIVKAL
jgi:dihydroorotate dehydrogenase